MFLYLLNLLFTLYTFMLLIRVLGSWIPPLAQSKFMQFIGFYTDPYLNFFRKIIPPLGMFDVSAIIAFFALQLLQYLLFAVVK